MYETTVSPAGCISPAVSVVVTDEDDVVLVFAVRPAWIQTSSESE